MMQELRQIGKVAVQRSSTWLLVLAGTLCGIHLYEMVCSLHGDDRSEDAAADGVI